MPNGHCLIEYAQVQEEFARNFSERGELGASVCVMVDGEPVVDLWGGIADPSTGRSWERDTLQVIFSSTKGMAALCGHILASRGQLDFDAPVTRYWPEFGVNGKEDILVRHVFSHQSGVAHVDAPVPEGGFTDWALMVQLIERTRPFWEPGTRVGYHGLSFGWLVGEIVRRISGRSIGTFFREEVADPLGLDAWIGLPQEHESRVAPSIPADAAEATALLPSRVAAEARNRESLMFKMLTNNGGWHQRWNTRAFHAAEIPAAGGIANARSLAGIYSPLSHGGASAGVRIVSPSALPGMRALQASTDVDATLGVRTSFTLGFSKSWNNPGVGNSVTLGEGAFGAAGLGGQIGFADPDHRLAFAYTTNKHGAGGGLDPRGQALVDAVYRALGSPTKEPGFWVKPES